MMYEPVSCSSFINRNNVILDSVDIQTPPYERMTTGKTLSSRPRFSLIALIGMWMDVPKTVLELMKQKGINPADAIHAAQHAVLNQTHLSSDLKTECKVPQKEYAPTESSRKRPAR